jgi:AraC-like DNA-binding protein
VWRTKLEELGVSIPAVLREAKLPQDFFNQARVLANTDELFALWQAMPLVAQDPAIGLKLGTETRLERIHPMGIAALSTETFGDGVRQIARYKKLCVPEEIIDQTNGNEWIIQYHWLLATQMEPPALMECGFAYLLNIARKGTGQDVTPLRVEFIQPRSHTDELKKHFGCQILYNRPKNAIVFKASDAAIPFVTRNTELLDALTPQFDQELEEGSKNATDCFVEVVCEAIQQRLAGRRPSVEDIAKDLHMSVRSLQRKLQELGSTFQQVLDDARHQLARYYLSNSVFELTEAAYLLGYEDADSFTRAFRSWEGVPPRHWRETHYPAPSAHAPTRNMRARRERVSYR